MKRTERFRKERKAVNRKKRRKITDLKKIGINVDALARNAEKMYNELFPSNCKKDKLRQKSDKTNKRIFRKEILYISR